MSYYAYRSGDIYLTKSPIKILEELKEEYPEAETCIDLDTFIRDEFAVDVTDIFFDKTCKKHTMSFYNDDRYDEDSYIEMLEALADYIEQPAIIEFRGEDDSTWKLTLKDNEVTEMPGKIRYEDEEPTYITLDDVKRFIQSKDFKDFFDDKFDDTEKLYKELKKDMRSAEVYWTNDKIKELIFAIIFDRYHKCGDNYIDRLITNQP